MPSLPIRNFEPGALKRAARETAERIDALQPLQSFERFPSVAAGLFIACRAEAKRLAGHVVIAPGAVVIRIDHLGCRDVTRHTQMQLRAEAVTDMSLAN